MVRRQWEVERPEHHVGSVKRYVLKRKEACGREDVEPGPVPLSPHFVGGYHRVLGQRPEADHYALEAKDRPGGCEVPENLLLSQQGVVG